MWIAAISSVLLFAAGEPTLAEQQAAEFEKKLLAELASVSPSAVPDAESAGVAYRARRWQEVVEGYDRVLVAAPRFPHALRRQCRARAALGDRAGALSLCRAALDVSPTPENRIALAEVLLTKSGEVAPTADERSVAGQMARRAFEEQRDDVLLLAGVCDVALRVNHLDLLKDCSDQFERLAPGDLAAEYFAIFGALVREEYRAARQHLAEARAAGLDPEAAGQIVTLLDENEPAWSRWGPVLAVALLGWAATLSLLLVAGVVLSAATLRRARHMATSRERGGGRGAVALRKVYAAVLWLTCGVYYLSLPLVVVILLAGGYAAWIGFAAIGRVPIKLVAIVGITILVSVWAVLKSVWASIVRRQGDDPGLRLDLGEHPHFRAALNEVARRVRTRPVDTVFVTPGTDAAVYERGGLARQLTRRTERCLILGVGLLDGMTQGQLKSVLAHEYGHFVNEDTAGGGFALAVRRSVLQMAEALAAGGAAAWYNPAWQFVRSFHKLFLRVSQGASRLQEILADRWAALAYGGKTFEAGFRHVLTRSIRFDKHVDATLREVIDGERALRNLYRYEPSTTIDEQEVAGEVEKTLNAEPTPYDSHPRPADRIAWVSDVASAHAADRDEHGPAWSLFADREALECRLTEDLRTTVAARHGIHIPAEAPATADAVVVAGS